MIFLLWVYDYDLWRMWWCVCHKNSFSLKSRLSICNSLVIGQCCVKKCLELLVLNWGVSDKQMSMSPSIATKKQEVWMSGFQTWKLFCASRWWRAAWELLRPSLKCQLFCQPATCAAHLPTSKSGVSQGPHHPTGSWSPVLQAVGHQSQSLGRQWLTQGSATIN